MRIYINKIGIRNTFKYRTRYYFKILTPETMKLLGSAINKTTGDQNGENVPCLEITVVVFVQLKIVDNSCQ